MHALYATVFKFCMNEQLLLSYLLSDLYNLSAIFSTQFWQSKCHILRCFHFCINKQLGDEQWLEVLINFQWKLCHRQDMYRTRIVVAETILTDQVLFMCL